uniref:Uncharacterized protein n=1 Tax=Romanomermis culicivorax TaxID=13658 RepID=A0A915JXI5_ROMCU
MTAPPLSYAFASILGAANLLEMGEFPDQTTMSSDSNTHRPPTSTGQATLSSIEDSINEVARMAGAYYAQKQQALGNWKNDMAKLAKKILTSFVK